MESSQNVDLFGWNFIYFKQLLLLIFFVVTVGWWLFLENFPLERILFQNQREKNGHMGLLSFLSSKNNFGSSVYNLLGNSMNLCTQCISIFAL